MIVIDKQGYPALGCPQCTSLTYIFDFHALQVFPEKGKYKCYFCRADLDKDEWNLLLFEELLRRL